MSVARVVAAACLAVACSEPAATAIACSIGPGELVITEVLADVTGPDAGREWLEVTSRAPHELELRGVTLRHSREDGSKARQHQVTAGVIAPGQYFVFGNNAPDLLPAHVAYGYGAELGELQNASPGRLELSCGADRIDEVVYRVLRPDRSYALDGGEPADALANDEPGRWCDTSTRQLEPGVFGSPGEANEDCEVILPGRCVDTGTLRDVDSPAPGELVITELMPDPDATADKEGEWVELYARRAFDLNGLLLDRQGDAMPAVPIAAEACLRVAPGWVVLAHARDPGVNGGLPRVDGPLPISLVGGSAQSPGDLALLRGAELLDRVSWRRSAAGKALQLDPDFIDHVANDDERVFCDARASYGAGDRGSPGAPNEQCVLLPPPGTCDDGGRNRPIVAPAPGQLVITELMANPAGVDSEREWFEVQNVGATGFDLNGLGVDRSGDTARPAPLVAAACLRVSPGRFAVVARSADPAKNGGLPPVTAVYALSSGDAGDLRLLSGDVLLDAVAWSDAPTSASLQLDPAFSTPLGNDDPARWCAASAAYGTGENRGTPAGGNRTCP